MPSHHPRQHDSRTNTLRILAIGAAVVAVLVGIYLVALRLEESQKKPDPTGDYNDRHAYDVTVEKNGHTYRQKSNLTTILLMGIDDYYESGQAVNNRNGGQADFLRLVVIDKNTKKVSQLAIDRDTMTPITTLGVMGNRCGTRTAQICLSHSFGNGRAQSCDLTREAVSNLLYGCRIDYYVAVNLDAVEPLNEALGGVTVTLEDDFTVVDPDMTQGKTLTLHGKQAETFVRTRIVIGDGTNESRMRRQQQYISQAASQFIDLLNQDENFVGRLFDELSPYMVNNIGKSRLILEAYDAKQYERPAIYQITGVHEVSDSGFMQFFPDDESVENMALTLFYDQLN